MLDGGSAATGQQRPLDYPNALCCCWASRRAVPLRAGGTDPRGDVTAVTPTPGLSLHRTRPPAARLVKQADRDVLDPERYSGHSLCAGLATAAGDAGAGLAELMRQTPQISIWVAGPVLRPADLRRNIVTEEFSENGRTDEPSSPPPGRRLATQRLDLIAKPIDFTTRRSNANRRCATMRTPAAVG